MKSRWISLTVSKLNWGVSDESRVISSQQREKALKKANCTASCLEIELNLSHTVQQTFPDPDSLLPTGFPKLIANTKNECQEPIVLVSAWKNKAYPPKEKLLN